MTLTPKDLDTLLAALDMEIAELRRLDPHDYGKRREQRNVVAFIAGLIRADMLRELDEELAKGAAA